MAVKSRGLGKGLDSLIPDAVGEAKTKKEVNVQTDTPVKDEKGEAETVVKITMVEPNRKQPRKILMRIPYRSCQILLNSLV